MDQFNQNQENYDFNEIEKMPSDPEELNNMQNL